MQVERVRRDHHRQIELGLIAAVIVVAIAGGMMAATSLKPSRCDPGPAGLEWRQT